jgi:hypothetical protein
MKTDRTWFDDDGDAWCISLEWSYKDGVAYVSGFSMRAIDHDKPVTARLLREVPFGNIQKKELVQENSLKETVLSLYDEAQADGVSLHGKIMEALGVSYPTASRHIRFARDNNLIP